MNFVKNRIDLYHIIDYTLFFHFLDIWGFLWIKKLLKY